MRFIRSLWLFILGVGFGVQGCQPPQATAESPLPFEQPEQPQPKPKPGERAVASPPVLEWQWRELTGPLERHIDTVAFSRDGKLLAAGANDTICVWEADTGKLVTRMTLPEDQIYHRLAFADDGKTLVSDCREDRFIRFWDTKTGKQVRELPHPAAGVKPSEFSSRFKTFDPAGRFLVRDAHRGFDGTIEVIDLAEGKRTAEVKAGEFDAWAEVTFAPDGKSLALNGPENRLRVFETATGKLLKELRGSVGKSRGGWLRSYARFSPDGQFLIAQEHTGRVETFDIYRTVIWGVADGRRYYEQEEKAGAHVPRWMSPDNRYTLSGTAAVFDLITERLVPIKNAPEAGNPLQERRLVSTSADGKTLAFVGAATRSPATASGRPKLSIYLAPAPVLHPPGGRGLEGGDLSSTDLDSAWAGAVADNLFRREHNLKALGMRPTQTIALAEKKLKPITEAEGKRIGELVKRLDDDDADVRDKATAELHLVAHRFEPCLRVAQRAAQAGEVRNRLIRVVQKLRDSNPPPELVAELRGIALLEQLRTAEARTLLEKLGAGFPGARVTDEAVAALKRLGKARP